MTPPATSAPPAKPKPAAAKPKPRGGGDAQARRAEAEARGREARRRRAAQRPSRSPPSRPRDGGRGGHRRRPTKAGEAAQVAKTPAAAKPKAPAEPEPAAAEKPRREDRLLTCRRRARPRRAARVAVRVTLHAAHSRSPDQQAHGLLRAIDEA